MVYKDETGALYLVVEPDGRLFIHTELKAPGVPSVLKHYKQVLSDLEDGLRQRGITQYYTMADSVEGFRFNELMGFETNMEVWSDCLEIMVKELN
jgi:hypothetical protein